VPAMDISAVIITRNEESNIRDCLASVSWAREIVVVDAESTDRTREIALEFTTLVHEKKWEGYAEAKAFAISRANSEWVLSLDADERVSEQLRNEIQALSEGGEYQGYLVPIRPLFLGRWIRHCGWYPGYKLRLFKKARAGMTPRRLHEGIRVEGATRKLESPLLHLAYPTVHSYFRKFTAYTDLAAQELHDEGRRARLPDLVLRPLFSFVKMYLFKRGFLDGLEGFILCVFSSFYVFVKYVKLREMGRKTGKTE
jgi:glycosyltransferase involved in cell wall biosynthesis